MSNQNWNNRIICIDDEGSILENYRLILGATENKELQSVLNRRLAMKRDRSVSFNIACVSSGEEALELVARETAQCRPFALAFVDMKMPGGMGGLETIIEMKKIDPGILVAVVTAHTDRTVLQISDAFEHQDEWIYFNKPFSEGELVQAARNLVSSWNIKRAHCEALATVEVLKEKEIEIHRQAALVEHEKAEELAQAYAKLEKAKNQLIHAEKLGAIGQFAAGIAHDFNNILGSMLGYTELCLKRVQPGTPVEKYLRQNITACNRAGSLVKQILKFSRQDFEKKQVSFLKPSIDEGIELLKASFPSTVTIQYTVDAESAPILSSPSRLNEVFMNLCTNAAHAMDFKGVLEVALDEETLDTPIKGRIDTIGPGRCTRLTIRDYGHGMEPKVIDRIFEPFFTTKKPGEGTGLGLSVVYGIVKDHEGEILVESTLGEGTVFKLLFPQVNRQVENLIKGTGEIPGGTERILFVDDEEMLVELSRELLAMLGYSVVVKTSSADALEEFRKHPDDFDVVITDQTMPGMSGIELSSYIHQVRVNIPIILSTGFSNTMDEDNARRNNVAAILHKPLTQKELGETIRKVLDAHKE